MYVEKVVVYSKIIIIISRNCCDLLEYVNKSVISALKERFTRS